MSRTQLTTIERAFRVIDCFDLAPEAIDDASFAALDAELWLASEDLECAANEIVLTDCGPAPAMRAVQAY